MEKFRKMTKKEINALWKADVICVYRDFDEKMNNAPQRDRNVEHVPFKINAVAVGEWLTDGNLIICRETRYINTFLDFLCRGFTEDDAKRHATNDEVVTTSIYKRI